MPITPEINPEQLQGDHVDQLLSQLSPEQLEHLATALAADMQNPESHEGGEDVASLAQAIESHLASNPEAATVPDMGQEKTAALNIVKSAAYIEGFLTQAVSAGAAIKQAVDMYDINLNETIQNLKSAKLHGNQHKLDIDGDGKIEGSDLAKLRHEKLESKSTEKKEHMSEIKSAKLHGNQHKLDIDGDGKIEGSDLAHLRHGKKESSKHEKSESAATEKKEHMFEAKKAAYYEGLCTRASEYGLTEKQAFALLKTADIRDNLQQSIDTLNQNTNNAAQEFAQTGDSAKYITTRDSANSNISQLQNFIKNILKSNHEGANLSVGGDSLPAGLGSAANVPMAPYGSFPAQPFKISPADISNRVENAGFDFSNAPEMSGPPMNTAPIGAKIQQLLGGTKDKLTDAGSAALGYLKDLPDTAKGGLGALGLAAGGAGLYHMLNKKKNQQEDELQPKEAAYYEGMLKRAQEYNLSPSEISYLLNTANNR